EYAWAFSHRGSRLPAFRFRDRAGRAIDGAALRGQVTILNFWFTQCKPCIAEMPELNGLVAANKGKSVLFIAPTFEPERAVATFLKRYPFEFRIVPGQKAWLDSLGFGTFPTTLVVDRKGVIRDVFIGAETDLSAKLQVAIDRLLTER
ncbi:MAG: TlpA family protein disulfide reductase, partial [Chitinophagaceae bacterium]